MDLAQLFNKYGSDKDVNGYAQLYHTLFDKMQKDKLVILEIGIGTMIPGVHSSMVGYGLNDYKPGGSLRAWRDYFTESRIIGADVQPDTQFSDEPRIETYLCNSTSKTEVQEFMAKLGNIKFDIIIDDGSHIDDNQYLTLGNFYPFLKDGGIYIIEDIYPSSKVSKHPQALGSLCNNDPYFFVGVSNNLCVIYKKNLKSVRRGF